MDSPQPVHGFTGRKHVRVSILVISIVILALIIIALAVSSKNRAPEPNFIWLDQAEFARQMHPGRLKRLYYKALNLAAPLLKHFKSSKKQLVIDTSIFASHGTTIEELRVGVPVATNELGSRLWILSTAELQNIRYRIQDSKGVNLVNRPRMTLLEGTRASICVGQSAPQGTAFIGVSVDMFPKVISHQFQVGMNALYTEPGDIAANVKTNISAACRVMVPNAGAVLIASPDAKQSNGTNFWLLLSPTAIDGAGNAISL